MLDGEDLAPITQRALGQKADFREAVEDHARGLDALDGVENLLRGFTKLQIGRVQQALLLFRIEQALGRDQFEDADFWAEGPAVGCCAITKLGLRLG